MANNKTVANNTSVEEFLGKVENVQKQKDSFALLALIKEITQLEPKMWGTSIIGFGEYHYKYNSGREGDMFLTGFSPRKQDTSVYIMTGFEEYKEQLSKLGKHRIGKSCLYIKKLENINQDILKILIRDSVDRMNINYNQI